MEALTVAQKHNGRFGTFRVIVSVIYLEHKVNKIMKAPFVAWCVVNTVKTSRPNT